MKSSILILLTLSCLNSLWACDCKTESLKEGFNNSSDVVLGKIIKKEIKYHIIDHIKKDSIQKQYHRLIVNDSIRFVEYTIKVIKNYKGNHKASEVILRAEADGSNCDIKLNVGETYMIYGYNNRWNNLYYPPDKFFILSSVCTRTTENWKMERKQLEQFLKAAKK